MTSLTELSKISKILNEDSNRVNELLKEFERKVCAMNPGVEVWAYDDPLLTNESSFYDGEKEKEYRESHDVVLGWARMGDKYMLATQSVRYEKESGEWVITNHGQRTPLLQAPRELRIEALGKIDGLVNALTKKAQEVVESIKAAQQTIEKL